jgi:hypothetical protein
MTPIYNAIVGGTNDVNFKSLSGARLLAVGKISEVNKNGSLSDKPLVANESQYGSDHLSDRPLLKYNSKIWSIPSDADNHQGEENISVSKNIPLNVSDTHARYINRGVLQQFALFGTAKYKSANQTKYDNNLTNMMIAQTKVRGKLYRIEGEATYDKSYNRFDTDSNCLFEYGVQFLGDQEKRYLSRPKNVDTREDKYRNWIYGEITENNITAIVEFEQDIKQWFTGQENAEAKVAACGELITYAKHILTASNEQLNKEFDETYKSVGSQYDKIVKDRAEYEKWLANRNGEYVTKNPNGEVMTERYKDGNLIDGNIKYKNGNIFAYSYSGSTWSGMYRGNKVDEVKMIYPNGNVFYYDVSGVLMDDNLSFSNITSNGKLVTPAGDISRSCRAAKFINGKAEGKGGESNRKINIDYNVDYHDGLANGSAEVDIEDESKKLYYYLYFSATAKNGRIDGSAKVTIGDFKRNRFIYDNVIFTDGFITDKAELEDVYVDAIHSYLKTLYPIECDVSKRLELKQ